MTQVEEAKKLISQLIVKVKELTNERDSLQGEVITLNEKLSSFQEQMDDSFVSKASLESDIEQGKKDLSDLQKKFLHLEDEHNRCENAFAKLSRIHKGDLDKNEVLRKQLSDLQIDNNRKDESIKNLQSVKNELLEKNRELQEKLSRMNLSSETEANGVRVIVKPYKFGKTSETIIEKAKRFIDGMFENAKVDTLPDGMKKTYLNNFEGVANSENITEHETDVFMERLQKIKYNDMTLFMLDDDGNLVSYFDKDWMKNYISSMVD